MRIFTELFVEDKLPLSHSANTAYKNNSITCFVWAAINKNMYYVAK